ncbi:putative rna-directed dna polymerase from transposon bs [Trichonephila clavipes]|nr:putative rna-directed dna polymerase from transposon bs [Trichonephila clavipes]
MLSCHFATFLKSLSAFSISYPVGKYCDNVDGEIATISFAIDKLESCSEHNIMFINSQAANLSLTNSRYNENTLVHSCRMKLIELAMFKKSIALQSIPSRCDWTLPFLEMSKRMLTKAGCLMSQPDSPLPLRIIKRIICSKLKINKASLYSDVAVGKRWNVLLNKRSRVPSSLPQSAGVACFCLLTRHDYLQRPLYHNGVKDSACCPLCQQGAMDGDHLRYCPIFLKFLEDNSLQTLILFLFIYFIITLLGCSSNNGRDAEDGCKIFKTNHHQSMH